MPVATVDGVKVNYEEAGTGSETLVFIHGWGASLKFWRPALEAFRSRFRAVAIDLPGFGDSDRPRASYTVEYFAYLVKNLLDALLIARPVLVGHSMGGTIALRLAVEFPDLVSRVVAVNSPVKGRRAFFLRTRMMLLPLLRLLLYVLSRVRWVRRWIAKDFTYETRLENELVDDIRKGSCRSLIRSMLSLRRTDLTERLASFQVPTLVVSSDHDCVIRSEQFEIARGIIPGCEYVMIAGSGHCTQIEKPQEFNAVLGQFLGKSHGD